MNENTANDRIKKARLTLGLSQEQMGTRVGITKGGISEMERGIRPISVRHVKMLALIFGISEQWVWTGEGEMLLDRVGYLRLELENQWHLSPDEASKIVDLINRPPDQRKQILESIVWSKKRRW